MSGIIPDPINDAVKVTDENGAPSGYAPQNGLYLAQGDAFRVNGGLYYLNAPSVGGSCGGRITPMQINAIVSEILCLMEDFNPTGHYDPTSGCNLATAFDTWKAALGGSIPSSSPSDVGKMLVVQADGSRKWATDADENVSGAHRGWRVKFNSGADANTQVGELEFREVVGVRQQSTGGTTIQSSRLSPGYDAAYSFDGSIVGSDGYWTPFSAAVQFLGYMHASVRTPVEVAIFFSSAVAHMGTPSDLDIEYSDDGTTWTSALHVDGLTSADWPSGGWKTFALAQVNGARIRVQNARDVNFPFVSGNNGKIPKYDHATGKLIPALMPVGVPAAGGNPDGDVLTLVGGVAAWDTPPAGSLPPVGSNGDVLTVVSGAAAWAPPSGGGGGSVDPAVAVPSAPGAGYVRLYALAPLIPIMTGGSTPSGTASAGSVNDPSNDPWHVFTGPGATGWVTAYGPGSDAWVQYQFPSAREVKAYKITPWSNDSWPGRVVTGWNLKGSNDGSTWTVIDTRSIPATRWQQGLSKTFVVATPGSYAYYRLEITAWNGDVRVGVNRMQMYGEATPISGDDMALFLIDENSRMTPVRVE